MWMRYEYGSVNESYGSEKGTQREGTCKKPSLLSSAIKYGIRKMCLESLSYQVRSYMNNQHVMISHYFVTTLIMGNRLTFI